MRRIAALFLCPLLAVGLLAACGGADSTEKGLPSVSGGYGDKPKVNTFRGFNVVAKPGNCQVILEFIDHLGSNEPGFSDYLLKIMAWKWQNKSKAPKVAIVLRSDGEGTGKGSFARLLEVMFSPATFTTSKGKHIVGGFNKQMEGIAVLIADEAMFAGDPAIRGELYSPDLGSIPLANRLSLLHIDGNHRYDHVRQDVETWSPYLANGGFSG